MRRLADLADFEAAYTADTGDEPTEDLGDEGTWHTVEFVEWMVEKYLEK